MHTRQFAKQRLYDSQSEAHEEDSKSYEVGYIGKRKIKYQHRAKISRVYSGNHQNQHKKLKNGGYSGMTSDKITLKSLLS